MISNLATPYEFQNFPHFTWGRLGCDINKIIIHYFASTNFDIVPGVWKVREGSAHYGIKDNVIRAYMDENNISWNCGNWNGNCTSVSIEHCNSTGSPEWAVSEETINSSVKLMADIAVRNGLGLLQPYINVFPHNYFMSTSCPGALRDRLYEMCERANSIINSGVDVGAGVTPSSPSNTDNDVWIDYQAYTEQDGWLPNVRDLEDYAGIPGHMIEGIYANSNVGRLRYRGHVHGGDWLPWVYDREDYIGMYGTNLDCIQAELVDCPGKQVSYRVAPIGGDYLPAVVGYNDENDDGYAGIYGKPIDRVQFWID